MIECRKKVAASLNIDETSLDLSMGMSGDYEQAVCLKKKKKYLCIFLINIRLSWGAQMYALAR